MTKVTDYNPEESLEELFLKSVNIKRNYYVTSALRKDITWRKRNFKTLIDRSFFDQASVLWNQATSAKQARWNTAGAVCGLTGYQLFVQDTSYRLANNLPGLASPSIYHQYKVLHGHINTLGSGLDLTQIHWSEYDRWIKNPGQKNAYTLTTITESVTAPIKVEFMYNADLEAGPTFHYCEFTITCWGKKDGFNTSDEQSFELPLVTGWTQISESFSPDLDSIRSYSVQLYFYRVLGDIWIDNFNFEHDGQNWAFDPFLDDPWAPNIYDEPWTYYNYDTDDDSEDLFWESIYL